MVSLGATVLAIAAAWISSDLGYYLLLPAVGIRPGYNIAPLTIGLYYAAWIAIAIVAFWPLYRSWKPFPDRMRAYVFLLASVAAVAAFAIFALPRLPSIVWTESWDAPELMLANEWYFLPKSVEILFQQLLIAALVLALAANNYPIPKIAIVCAILFGTTHLLLGFGGLPFGYVARFAAAAAAFGLLFPHLILRVPNGFAYSYALHWLYYIVTIVMAHTVSPYAT
ncbi:MAG TPA: hypothetical protein VFK79_15275 [Xanthobacteraceae bacterium]|nr:hypothetical protein [Xanthobacteraceae bacterium]